MKSEHRHQLETNDLSARLARAIENLKPFTGQIVTGIAALILVYLGLTIWNAQSAQREQEAWDAFAFAADTRDPELKGLQGVASSEEYAGTNMQEWAYAGWADRQVLIAMELCLRDREQANDHLRNVSGVYEQLASSANDPQVLNRARFGLARVYELQNKLDEARQQYLTVRGDLEPQASERAKQLDSEEVREACSWLATAELPKLDLTGGQGATGERPDFEADLPTTQSTTDEITAESLKKLLDDSTEAAAEGEETNPAESEVGEETPDAKAADSQE